MTVLIKENELLPSYLGICCGFYCFFRFLRFLLKIPTPKTIISSSTKAVLSSVMFGDVSVILVVVLVVVVVVMVVGGVVVVVSFTSFLAVLSIKKTIFR